MLSCNVSTGCIHGAQILGVVMASLKKRPRLDEAEGRLKHISASAVQPAIPADPLLDPAIPIWTIRQSHHQPPSTDFELTHKRPVPLPFAIDLMINGKTHACIYCGHGQSKVVSTPHPLLKNSKIIIMGVVRKEHQNQITHAFSTSPSGTHSHSASQRDW